MHKKITVSAPAKIHLIGEHAVVYGTPAIIAAVGLRTNLSLTQKISELTKEAKEYAEKMHALWQICEKKNDFHVLLKQLDFKKAAIGTVLNSLNLSCDFTLQEKLEVPLGAGLGSSSAFAVAITQGIAKLNDIDLTLDRINKIAFEIEKLAHGRPSGGDNAACCYGGLIWFEKGKNIRSLKNEVPHKLSNFLIIYTGKPEKTTGELVQGVRELEQSFREQRISAINDMIKPMLEACKNQNSEVIKEIINATHQNLSELGVSTKYLDEIHKKVVTIGGAAKLCGAGGGGVMLCYHKDTEKLQQLLSSINLKVLQADLGVEGIRL